MVLPDPGSNFEGLVGETNDSHEQTSPNRLQVVVECDTVVLSEKTTRAQDAEI